VTVLPERIDQAWEQREGPIVLATVDTAGTPNVIYATCVRRFDDTWVVADNYFNKTRANILSGSEGALLFITKEGKSYQIKGRIEYHTEGKIFEEMKQWNPTRLPGHAAAALKVEHVFAGGEQIV
jgi:predicted pyridoxine 5'-phosphate oxidase superfamily flavin-nucleotide-binding protein